MHWSHMAAMQNTLLEFFRLDNGKERPKVSPFRLQDVSETFERNFVRKPRRKTYA